MRHPRRRDSRRWPAMALWGACDPWAAARPRPSSQSGPHGRVRRQGVPERCGPAHALGCWTQECGAAACDARFVRAARGVWRAHQGAALALSPILFPILRKGALARIRVGGGGRRGKRGRESLRARLSAAARHPFHFASLAEISDCFGV